jgi:dGTPase
MHPLEQRLTAATSILALYAVPHRSPLGRMTEEPADATRFPFQRDRGRIVHSQAFRRLLGKTQVFVAGEGDHYRTRLTHTMEVTQIARDVARTLRLNEDLAECIALAHDLGHPPFGHMGEQALDAWMRGHGSTFEHNEQSLRVVTLLETHAHGSHGLNLHREVLDGLQKHRGAADRGGRGLSLEAQTVNLADEITYLAHDCEDGLRGRLFEREVLCAVPLAKRACENADVRGTGVRGALIHLLIDDLYAETDKRLKAGRIASLQDVYAATAPIAAFSEPMQSDVLRLRTFLAEKMYSHPQVLEKGEEGKRIVRALCDAFLDIPPQKIRELAERTGSSLPEAVKDYVAGMTDGYAAEQLEGITGVDVLETSAS